MKCFDAIPGIRPGDRTVIFSPEAGGEDALDDAGPPFGARVLLARLHLVHAHLTVQILVLIFFGPLCPVHPKICDNF